MVWCVCCMRSPSPASMAPASTTTGPSPPTPEKICSAPARPPGRTLSFWYSWLPLFRAWTNIRISCAAPWHMPATDCTICMWKNREITVWRQEFRQMVEHPCSSRHRFMMWQSLRTIFRMA